MRHRKLSKKLNRDTTLRKATIRGVVSGLISHEKINTTLTKAKIAKRLADKLITLGKQKDNIGSHNRAMQLLADKKLVTKLFKEVAPLFKNRTSGFTRIILCRPRKGDGAMMAILELTEKKDIIPAKPKEKKKAEKETIKTQKIQEKEKASLSKEDVKTLEEKVYHPKKDEDKDIVKEEAAKEKAKSETKQLDKGFFKGFKRYFRSNPRKGG